MEIANELSVSIYTVSRVRRAFVEHGLDSALSVRIHRQDAKGVRTKYNPDGTPHRVTPEIAQKIKEEFEGGATRREIAEKMGFGYMTIKLLIQRMNANQEEGHSPS